MNRTPQSTHHKKNPQTHRTARTQYSFFFLFSFLSFFFTVIPLNGQYHHHGLSPGVLVGGREVVLPPAAQWNWEATLQSAGQFSSDILYYLSISQCGRKRRMRRGRGSDREVSQRDGYRRWKQESEEPQQQLENN